MSFSKVKPLLNNMRCPMVWSGPQNKTPRVFAKCVGANIGYYLYNRATIPQQQTVLAQLWKEYALSDSRYLTQDVFTVCIEFITAVRLSPFPPFSPVADIAWRISPQKLRAHHYLSWSKKC